MTDTKFDWNDITIVPNVLCDIETRSIIDVYQDNKLPLFVSPMDTVVDENNYTKFIDLGINVCLPRHIKYQELGDDRPFYSFGLDEIISILDNNEELPKRVLIDIAQGHMKKLFQTSKRIKETRDVELMVGNIANPETYRKYCEIDVDWIRVGIGGGQACTTSANVAIHYPMASLVNECYEISKEFNKPTKIVADGGFKNFSDIIKSLALGSNSVMLGSIFNKCLESCSDNFIDRNGGKMEKISQKEAIKFFNDGYNIHKYYRGMSTKEVQRFWNKKEIKTGEGISKYNKVEYTLNGWCENFIDYLKSSMSYTNCGNLGEFIGEVNFIKITQNSFNRFSK